MTKESSFRLPPAVGSVKSISPRTSQKIKAEPNSKNMTATGDLKDQIPMLKGIYENPPQAKLGNSSVKKRKKSKKNMSMDVKAEGMTSSND